MRMNTGKLTNEQLKEFVIGNLKIRRSEVLLGAGVGIDCAMFNIGKDFCAVSTDPITASSKDAGKLAVHVSANDIAASGAEPFAILVTVLVPPTSSLEELKALMDEIAHEAERMEIDIVGGHTEVTDAVNKPIISITALGRTEAVLDYKSIAPGDVLILTKSCGIEGALIIAGDYPERIAHVLIEEDMAVLKRMESMLSVVKDARIAKSRGAIAMHDITEGGVFGAVYELAEAAGLGVVLDETVIPIHPIANKLCAVLDIDVFRLISSGSLLIASKAEDSLSIIEALEHVGIEATVIGKFQKCRIETADGKAIDPPTQDALYQIAK